MLPPAVGWRSARPCRPARIPAPSSACLEEALDVYAKPPFARPKAVPAYLSRYTHRVAIARHRLISQYRRHLPIRGAPLRRRRAPPHHDARHQRVYPPLPAARPAQGLPPHPALRPARQRRPQGQLAKARYLLAVPAPSATEEPTKPPDHRPPCPCCGGRMTIIETFKCARQASAAGHRQFDPTVTS